MDVLSCAQNNINCFDQGFKCFARHLAWCWQWHPFVSIEFKARFDVWCFTTYICSIFAQLACTYSLNVAGNGGTSKNTDIMRRHETQGRFWFLHKGNTDEKDTQKQRINKTYLAEMSVSLPRTVLTLRTLSESLAYPKKICFFSAML